MLVTADGLKPSSAVPATERINWKTRWFRKDVFFRRRKAKIWKGNMHSGIPRCVYSSLFPALLVPTEFLLSDHTPALRPHPLLSGTAILHSTFSQDRPTPLSMPLCFLYLSYWAYEMLPPASCLHALLISYWVYISITMASPQCCSTVRKPPQVHTQITQS